MGNKESISHNDKATYFGDLKNDKFHGNGTLYYKETGDLYKGQFKHGERHGLGELHYYGGDKYIGEFYHNELHGNGKYITSNGYICEGFFSVGSLLGKGTMHDSSGNLLYEGDFLNSLPHGFGVSYLNGKILYVGKWNQNLYHGYGLLIENNVNKYGLFKEGELVEEINKIPDTLLKYIKNTYLHNKNVNLSYNISKNKANTKLSLFTPVIPINNSFVKQAQKDSRIIENPFNRVNTNPFFNNITQSKNTFDSINTRKI